MTAATDVQKAHFALIRWLNSPGRGEAKNLGVILFDAEGAWTKVKVAPLKRILPSLADTVVDDYLGYLEGRAQEGKGFTLTEVRELFETHVHSLQFTEPRPAAVPADENGPDATVDALYRALVAPPGRGGGGETKSRLKGKVRAVLDKSGLRYKADARVAEFSFDFVIEGEERPVAVGVFSFNADKKDWLPEEQAGGYLLYALHALRDQRIRGAAIVAEPREGGNPVAENTWRLVTKWMERDGVPVVRARDVFEKSETALATLVGQN